MAYLVSLLFHAALLVLLLFGGALSPDLRIQTHENPVQAQLISAADLKKLGLTKPDPTRLPPPVWTPPVEAPEPKRMAMPDPKPVEKKPEVKTPPPKSVDRAEAIRQAVKKLRPPSDRPKPKADNYGYGKDVGEGGAEEGGEISGESIPFVQKMRDRVVSNFYVVDESLLARLGELTTIIKFRLNPDRSIRSLTVERSSGNSEFDRKFEFAIRKSAPFDEVPDEYLNSAIIHGFRFELSPKELL